MNQEAVRQSALYIFAAAVKRLRTCRQVIAEYKGLFPGLIDQLGEMGDEELNAFIECQKEKAAEARKASEAEEQKDRGEEVNNRKPEWGGKGMKT